MTSKKNVLKQNCPRIYFRKRSVKCMGNGMLWRQKCEKLSLNVQYIPGLDEKARNLPSREAKLEVAS